MYDTRPIRSLTQEDPIGLAGGLNLYGFAGGDPVNYSDPFGLCPPIEDCLRKANAAGILLVMANGGRPLSLGHLDEGQSVTVGGVDITATQLTTEGLGLSPTTGDATIGFQGGLQVDVNNAPDPILVKGALNLGTGRYEATGRLHNIPTSSVHVIGNLKTGKGNAESCVLIFVCHNTPLQTPTGHEPEPNPPPAPNPDPPESREE